MRWQTVSIVASISALLIYASFALWPDHRVPAPGGARRPVPEALVTEQVLRPPTPARPRPHGDGASGPFSGEGFLQPPGGGFELWERNVRVTFGSNGATVFAAGAEAVRWRPIGELGELTAERPHRAPIHWFLGDDPRGWKPNTPLFGALRYRNLAPGVEVLLEPSTHGVEYTVFASNAQALMALEFEYAAARRLSVAKDGEGLTIETAAGTLTESGAIAWHPLEDGARKPITARHALAAVTSGKPDAQRYRFELDGFDPALPVVLDPSIVWSAFIDGTGDQLVTDAVPGASGAVYVTGTTSDVGIAGPSGQFAPALGGTDIFVSELDSDGALIWTSVIGGTLAETGGGVAFDATNSRVLITGTSSSSNYPTKNAGNFKSSLQGGRDVVVSALSASGTTLHWSFYEGTAFPDIASDIVWAPSGRVYFSGLTGGALGSASSPTNHCLQNPAPLRVGNTTCGSGGPCDGFIAALNFPSFPDLPNAAHNFGLLAGGDVAMGELAVKTVATDDYVFTAGTIASPGKFSGTAVQGLGAFAAAVRHGTGPGCAGGALIDGAATDRGLGLHVLGTSSPFPSFVTGFTQSSGVPGYSAGPDSTLDGSGSGDAFAARIDFDLTTLTTAKKWFTYAGGGGLDVGTAVTASGGAVYVVGETTSVGFATMNGFQSTQKGGKDGFVLSLPQAAPASFDWISYLGGTQDDDAIDVLPGPGNSIIVAGTTSSSDFPQRSTAATAKDAFVVRISTSVPGSACTADVDCPSNTCRGGFCCAGACGDSSCASCSSGTGLCLFNIGGLCRMGGECEQPAFCLSGFCPAPTPKAPGTPCRAADAGCDLTEVCDGTLDCPADDRAEAGTICRAVDGGCDLAEECDGVSAACPFDVFEVQGVLCRADAGTCDFAAVCSGNGPTCPPNVHADAGTVCRPAAGKCDQQEVCNGSAQCPLDLSAPQGTVCRQVAGDCDVAEKCSGFTCPATDVFLSGGQCRAAQGVCDAPESCNGAGPSCPPNLPAPAGTECRPIDGGCDLAETCSAFTCPPDVVMSTTAVCRPADGGCDVEEKCVGTPHCPADGFAPPQVVCRPDAGLCDLPESCPGNSAACPSDQRVMAGTACRASAGACDPPELCDGTVACPPQAFADAGALCRPADGGCDLSETCTGSSQLCPPDVFADAGWVCRKDAGLCDVPEVCPGGAPSCPGDAVVDAGTRCRASQGICDQEDFCDGTSPKCLDVLFDGTKVCGPSLGLCDVEETCTGGGPSCPPDLLAPKATECRKAVGGCDLAERCAGDSSACPEDRLADAGTGCRMAVSSCDVAEVCAGDTVECPADLVAPDNTPCSDGGICEMVACVFPGAPVAVLTATPDAGAAPLSVLLDGRASTFVVATGAAQLDPGDGQPPSPVIERLHVYQLPGSYTAHLTLKDAQGLSDEARVAVRVSRGTALPPEARIIADPALASGRTLVNLSCDCHAGSSPIATTEWTIGDHHSLQAAFSVELDPGLYNVTLTVTDTAGVSTVARGRVQINDGALEPPRCDAFARPVAGLAELVTKLSVDFDPTQTQRLQWTLPDASTLDDVPSFSRTIPTPQEQEFALQLEGKNGLRCFDRVRVTALGPNRELVPIITSTPPLAARCYEPFEHAPSARSHTSAATWTVESPEGATIDPSTGYVRWTPTPAQAGTQQLKITATNGGGSAVLQENVEVTCTELAYTTNCGCAQGTGAGAGGVASLALGLVAWLSRRSCFRSRFAAPRE